MDGKFAYVSCHSSRVKFDIELFRNGKKITTVKTLFLSNESHFVKLLDDRFGGLRRQPTGSPSPRNDVRGTSVEFPNG